MAHDQTLFIRYLLLVEDLIYQRIELIESEGLLLERSVNLIKALRDVREQFGERILCHRRNYSSPTACS